MIITMYGIIVFQLVERIAITEKSIKSVLRKCSCMLGFSYNAIPTRHEVLVAPLAGAWIEIKLRLPNFFDTEVAPLAGRGLK